MEFLNKDMNKNKDITHSRWDVQQPSLAQIHYACIDAFVSLLLGVLLLTTTNQLDHQQQQETNIDQTDPPCPVNDNDMSTCVAHSSS